MKQKNIFLKSFFNIKKTLLKKKNIINNNEFFFEEHIIEIKQRFLQSFLLIFLFIIIAFSNANFIVKILQKPVSSIKFFQLSPGDYFISTIEISLFFGLLISSPIFINQLIFFLFPGLNDDEKNIILILIIASITLFFLSLNFSYFVLIPITLGFFINYSKNSIQPLLSFNQYIGFIGVLFFSTGILFQVPIIQVILSLLNIISGKKMLEFWKYIVLILTIISAIFTPSADPLAQIILTLVLTFLYIGGSLASIFLKKI
jgi:sec-independent protein translocase protein TatC